IFVRDARPAADLALTLADTPDPTTTKANLTYTATIANTGPTTATAVTLIADLPAASRFVSASGATCTRQGKGASDGTLTCDAGTTTADSPTTVTTNAPPTNPATLTPAAKFSPPHPPPTHSNNSPPKTPPATRKRRPAGGAGPAGAAGPPLGAP